MAKIEKLDIKNGGVEDLLNCIKKINDKHGISMPIADMVYNILYCRANARRSMKALTELL